MANVFVSYSRRDRKRVKPLVELLEAQGWSVWWDREISPGDSFEELIDQQITEAQVVIVVWSKHSIESRWVRNEALEAMERDILVPVQLDDRKLPVAFRQAQAADFTRWPGRVDNTELRLLLDAVAKKLKQPVVESTLLPSRRSKRRVYFGLGAVAVAALLFAQNMFFEHNVAPGFETPTLAVMRMTPANSSAEEIFFADSLADEVSAVLAESGRINLSRRVASWEIPRGLSRREIASRLNVNYLLEGHVRREQRTEIVVGLVDVRTDEELLLETFVSEARDIQTLRTLISNAAIAALPQNPIGKPVTVLAKQPTYDSRAYERYLRAKDLLRQSGEAEQLSVARDLLIQATQLDPSLGAAFAGLCRAYLGLYKDTGASKSFEEAERACHRALTLRQRSAETFLALGKLNEISGQYKQARTEYEQALRIDPLMADALSGIAYTLAMEGDHQNAERAFLDSVSIQPGYWRSHNSLGWYYLQQGRLLEAIDAYTQVTYLAPNNAWGYSNLGAARFGYGDFDAAIREWRQANAIDPESGALSNIGTAHFYLREFDLAANMYVEALALAPNDYRLWINLGDALRYVDPEGPQSMAGVGDARSAYRKAIDFAAREQAINPTYANASSAQAVAFAFLGESAQAHAMIQRALATGSEDPEVLYHAALTEVSLRDPDAALDFLQRAVENGYPRVFVREDPLLDDLRDKPEFVALAVETPG